MTPKLTDQICFPLYAASRAIQQRYMPVLRPLGLTYPQYLVMLVLWEQDGRSISDIGQQLWLDSGTLTPLLKRMEAAQLVTRTTHARDRRVRIIELTEDGLRLQERARHIPDTLRQCMPGISTEQLTQLKHLLDQLLPTLREETAEGQS